ncbi:MAG: AAA family ATPase [Chloroflexi bacterium]|nr:AAA family ATPase [Chloroflexota bacterium]
MILKTVHVKNYKCVRDSNEFRIDDKITYLVGKNESGKTTLLQAIAKINPVDPDDGIFDVLEYPRRHLVQYQERQGQESDQAVSTTWELTQEDIADLERIAGPPARQITTVGIAKGYSNQTHYDFDIDEAAVIQHILATHGLERNELRNLKDAGSLQELHSRLTGKDGRSDREQALLVFLITNYKDYDVRQGIIAKLEERLPKIAYFSEYLRMPGQVSVTGLKSRLENDALEEGDKIFLALLDMIGKTVDDLEQLDQHEMLTAQLEGASERVTQEIFRYWSQNQSLRVQFLLQRALPGDPAPYNEGWVLRTRIQNTRQGDTTSFDERSAGMVWFFSFLVWFNQIRSTYGDNLILLLDDPGLALHGRAQADLLKYIEERLASNYQVIYTTHSPFMIDPANLSRARTVENIVVDAPESSEDGLLEGTKVGDRVLSSDRDTLLPLQVALGYGLAKSLAVAENTLLVDGPSEVLYLQWFKRKLASMGKSTLDDRWVITPCGGVEKVAAFMSLMSGGPQKIAVVGSFPAGQGLEAGETPETKLMKEGHVLTWDSYTKTPNSRIEDVIGRDAYLELAATAYGLSKEDTGSLGRAATVPVPLIDEVRSFLEALPQFPKPFYPYRPAEYLIQQGMGFTLTGLNRGLDRFEELFKDLNFILNRSRDSVGVGRSKDEGSSGGFFKRLAFWR